MFAKWDTHLLRLCSSPSINTNNKKKNNRDDDGFVSDIDK